MRIELQGNWPASAPKGECIIKRLDDIIDGPRLWIERADPRIVISAELLQELEVNQATGLQVPGVSLHDRVLRVEAENRTVVYRIGEYFAPIHAYLAEWPD